MEPADEFAKGDDELLSVLQNASSDERMELVRILKLMPSCKLRSSCTDPVEITAAFQEVGGNVLVNQILSHGVRYEDIVDYVAAAMKAGTPVAPTVQQKEWVVLVAVIAKLVEDMAPDELSAFKKALKDKAGAEWKDATEANLAELSPQALRMVVQTALKKIGGRKWRLPWLGLLFPWAIPFNGRPWLLYSTFGVTGLELFGSGVLLALGVTNQNTQICTLGVSWVGLHRLERRTMEVSCYIGGQQ